MVYKFFDKRSSGNGVDASLLLLNQIFNLKMNFIGRLLENSRETFRDNIWRQYLEC